MFKKEDIIICIFFSTLCAISFLAPTGLLIQESRYQRVLSCVHAGNDLTACRLEAGIVDAVDLQQPSSSQPSRPAPGNQGTVLYVDLHGNDQWSGHMQQPTADGRDGPVASIKKVQMILRALKQQHALPCPVQVVIGAGTYELTEPITLTPDDSGTPDCPIVYTALNQRVVVSGGKKITGFSVGSDGVWKATLPEVAADREYFEQLYVNDRIAPRARTPNSLYYYTKERANDDPHASFIAYPNDLPVLQGLTTAQLNAAEALVYHAFSIDRQKIKSVNPTSGKITFNGPSRYEFMSIGPTQRYVIENVKNALDAPGEWFLDKQDGTLYYMPLPNERIETTTFTAPKMEQLIVIAGTPAQPVHDIVLDGIIFAHTKYTLPAMGYSGFQADVVGVTNGQEVYLPAALVADYTHDISIKNSEFTQLAANTLWFRRGVHDMTVEKNYLHELGAGGVIIGETYLHELNGATLPTALDATQKITVTNTIIQTGGKLFPAAVGVWIGQSGNNNLNHNDIADFTYSGISLGWTWGDGPSASENNRIEFNHIHHLGNAVMSDLGGVYNLGHSPQTVVRNNIIHDIQSYDYYGAGGVGLYADEGTSFIDWENNLVYDVKTAAYNQNAGKENIVKNNIFAYGTEAQLRLNDRKEGAQRLRFENNIVYWNEGDVMKGTFDREINPMDSNVYWKEDRSAIQFMGTTFDAWKTAGHDQHSVIADPLFRNPAQRDFTLGQNSPAFGLGFRAIDFSSVGVQGDAAWKQKANHAFPATVPPPPPPVAVQNIDDTFEQEREGNKPTAGHVDDQRFSFQTIRVTKETAAQGSQSLKFADAPSPEEKNAHFPFIDYFPQHTNGKTMISFDLRITDKTKLLMMGYDLSDRESTRFGPQILVENKQLLAGKSREKITDLPVNQWMHIEAQMRVGNSANELWQLTVQIPGQPVITRNLQQLTATWKILSRLGFFSTANEQTAFYMDNVKITNAA